MILMIITHSSSTTNSNDNATIDKHKEHNRISRNINSDDNNSKHTNTYSNGNNPRPQAAPAWYSG